MPYIKSDDGRREALRNGEPALLAGELNYQIFYCVKHYNDKKNNTDSIRYMIMTYIDNFLGQKPNYQRYNDMTGCLIRCAKEIRRRLGINADYLITIMDTYDYEIAKYEDIKIESNGDVE